MKGVIQSNSIPRKIALGVPATTLALLKINAVVGVTRFFDGNGTLQAAFIVSLEHSPQLESSSRVSQAQQRAGPRR